MGVKQKCDLCGLIAFEVKAGLMRTPEGEYRAMPRCTDHPACRERLERNGQPWPVSRPSGR